MTTGQRVFVIAHLCLAFSLICWVLAGPFMGEYFNYKSQLLLYESVIGSPEAPEGTAAQTNAFHFSALPEEKRAEIVEGYNALEAAGQTSFLYKFGQAWWELAFGLPPFVQAWLFFSLMICLLLLFRIEGATRAAWLLPLITVALIVESRVGGSVQPSQTERLFPSESYLIQKYGDRTSLDSLAAQKEALLQAWQRYLVAQWARQEPSGQAQSFQEQVAAGEHAFHVAQLETVRSVDRSSRPAPKPLPLLIIYLIWNSAFAFVVNRRTKERLAECV